MPNLPHDIPSGAEDVRMYLQDALPDSQLTNAPVNPAYQPLLLLQTTHVMAAFAFSNGDMRKSYNALYGSFKEYYGEQRGKWDALDLAFVFCVRPDIPNLEGFCSNVETDVYFCRKFVVPLARPLGDTLARLPFLPLIPLNGRSFRPPSAQTFLQQCGVPAVLAKFLVVQRERSPEGIVEDCISGTFDEPRELTPAPNAPVVHIDRASAPVRLEAVNIKGFRAYREQQSFTIGTDVTVLYGPNGFGKTSFFDAIDFAVTGEIGRIRSSGEAHFRKMVKHLDSRSEESAVSLSLICNNAVRKVTRKVSDRKQALLDGRPTDRKTILGELTGGDIPAADRVENFVSLFRATHLFSQEHQELAQDFQDDCRLSEQIVSRMLAFEDYANAVNKATKVREVLRIAIASANDEITALAEQISDEKKELDRLSRSAEGHANLGVLGAEIASLRRKVGEIGISVTPEEPDVSSVRSWRASIEARHAESQSRTARLSNLTKEAGSLPGMLADLASLQQQLAQKEQALSVVDERRISAESELQRADQRLVEMTAKRAEAQSRAGLLDWVRTTKPDYGRILQKQREIADELKRARAAVAQSHEAEAKAAGTLRLHENLAAQATEKLAFKRAELAAVHALNETVATWQADHTRLAATAEEGKTLLSSLELLRAKEQELSTQAAAIAGEEAQLARQITEVDRNQSELRRLLSQLQGHVKDSTCPLCGKDHGSKDELIRSIQEHVAADAASSARLDLTRVQEKARQLAKQIADNKQKRQTVEAQLNSLRSERSRLAAEIGNFTDSLATLGFVSEASGSTVTDQLHVRENRAHEEVAALDQETQELESDLLAMRGALADAKELVLARTAEVTDREEVLTRLQEEANRLREDPRHTQISLDIEPAQLEELERLNHQVFTDFNVSVAKAEIDATSHKAQVSSLRQESTSLRAQLSSLRTQLVNLQTKLTQIRARLAEFKLPPDVTEETLLALIAEESEAQTQLLTLRDSATNIELAIDAATTAAALTRLRQNVRNKEKAVTIATQKRDQHQPWLKYFDDLSHLVSSQQSEAIANFTRDYGPRTSVIQRRLRSVYGFDEIEIQSHQSTISVRVRRHGEELRPTDYFSQSQQQTLLLGLFLTACLSQTWSALSPVFLDDPVTHFDDLNTYAFLDLIVGLLESDVGRRQFVISTCDEKFLQLARQKFRHLGGRAKFYRFSAISADGPVVNEIDMP